MLKNIKLLKELLWIQKNKVRKDIDIKRNIQIISAKNKNKDEKDRDENGEEVIVEPKKVKKEVLRYIPLFVSY